MRPDVLAQARDKLRSPTASSSRRDGGADRGHDRRALERLLRHGLGLGVYPSRPLAPRPPTPCSSLPRPGGRDRPIAALARRGGRTYRVGGPALGPFSLDRRRRERSLGAGRAVGLRQVHGAAAAGGAGGADAGRGGRARRDGARPRWCSRRPTLMPWADARWPTSPAAGAGGRRAGARRATRAADGPGRRRARQGAEAKPRAALRRHGHAGVAGPGPGHPPRLLLLDEPFAALDEITRRRLADDVLALWAASGPAIVFVTHNVEEAVYMAARVVVMTPGPGRIAGEIAIDGPLPRPAGLPHRPRLPRDGRARLARAGGAAAVSGGCGLLAPWLLAAVGPRRVGGGVPAAARCPPTSCRRRSAIAQGHGGRCAGPASRRAG